MPSFFSELKRRNVIRVGIAYVVVAWLLAQVAELALGSFGSPGWVMKTILLVLALGLPLALFFAWAFELTPEGLKKEKDVDRSQSITHRTGRKLDFIIIGVLTVALAYFVADKFVFQPDVSRTATTTLASAPTEPDEDTKSIAVLPFVDMSPAKDQEYFTDGLSENLLNALAQISEIKVAGRTSSFAFKGLNQDLRGIGEQLNVRNILEGSVQKAGSQIRITAQLVNTKDGFHLWSETFDRNLDDIFAVQDEITVAVVQALRESILGQKEIAAGYSGNFVAYNAYLLGQSYHSQKTIDGYEKAIAQYRRALEIDANMALAWAGLSRTIAERTGFGFDTSFAQGYEQAREAAEKAIELNPNLPEGYLALADVQHSHDWNWPALERSLRRALELRPGDPDIRAELAELLAIRGDIAGAFAQIQQVLAQDPLNMNVQRQRIWLLIALHRSDEALAGAQRMLASDPDMGALGLMLSIVHNDRGEHAKALAAAKKETFPFLRLTGEAIAYHALGDSKTAEEKLTQLVDELGDDVSYQVAAIYSLRGDLDRAFEALERGFAIRDPGLVLIQAHTAFEPLRDDPRYDALLKRMGLR
ncbi:MAG: FlgO family outer membrane protein [Gammaproteobacteria bacterium]|nr:FlgO family outer membrane protein [Gammaproteobacteria bacterium]